MVRRQGMKCRTRDALSFVPMKRLNLIRTRDAGRFQFWEFRKTPLNCEFRKYNLKPKISSQKTIPTVGSPPNAKCRSTPQHIFCYRDLPMVIHQMKRCQDTFFDLMIPGVMS